EPFTPQQDLLDKMDVFPGTFTTYYGRGCDECRGTGYRGRTGIFEFMAVDGEMRRLILENVSSDVIRQKAVSKGMRVLRDCGWDKVRQGITTIEEVLRVSQEGM
ncbi:MAG: type II secretion system protein GspE, partial [Nitrospiraceae bacterium]